LKGIARKQRFEWLKENKKITENDREQRQRREAKEGWLECENKWTRNKREHIKDGGNEQRRKGKLRGRKAKQGNEGEIGEGKEKHLARERTGWGKQIEDEQEREQERGSK
jgi:hypothetical protein